MLKLSRRAVLVGSALLRAIRPARAASLPRLTARQEMAVQVVDFGWKRDGGMFDSGGPNGAATVEVYTLETSAHHVRFRFQNGLAQSWTISGAAYAPTARAQTNPADAAGAPVPLRPVTFGNNGQDVALEEQSAAAGAPTSLVLPPAAKGAAFPQNGYLFRGIPNVMFSDWMPIETLPRADGGQGALVMLRVMTPSPEFSGIRPTRVWGHALFQGTPARPWRTVDLPQQAGAPGFLTAGDLTDPEPFDAYAGNALCCGIQAIGDTPGLTLLSVGDSNLMGGGEAQGYLGPIKRAADLMSTPQLPVSHVASAIYGCPSGAFFNAGRLAIQTNKVSCAVMQVWSGNDRPQNLNSAKKAWAAAQAFAAECERSGVLPIFLSPGPPPPGHDGDDKTMIHLWTMSKLYAQNRLFIDLYKVLGTPTPDEADAELRPNLRAADNVHGNSASNALVAQAVVALLQSLPVVQA